MCDDTIGVTLTGEYGVCVWMKEDFGKLSCIHVLPVRSKFRVISGVHGEYIANDGRP